MRQSRFVFPRRRSGKGIKRVKENEGAAGVDEQTIEDFEKRLKKNL
jgi:SOS response regulatory protein OraA/RecX